MPALIFALFIIYYLSLSGNPIPLVARDRRRLHHDPARIDAYSEHIHIC